MAKTKKDYDKGMTQRVGLHVHVKIDKKEMENSVKVRMAKTIKMIMQ